MSSNMRHTTAKRRQRLKRAGRKRKNQMSLKSTLSAAEFFADLGEPGQPAPPTPAPSK